MGLETLPNGITYFNLSDELSVFTTQIYSAITPVNIGIISILTVIFVAMVVMWALYVTRKIIEMPINNE